MVVGVLRVRLRLFGVASLKQKRGLVRSVLDRSGRKFRVSAAEVSDNDALGAAGLGFAVVSNDGAHANAVLDRVLDFVEAQCLGQAEIAASELELAHFGAMGG